MLYWFIRFIYGSLFLLIIPFVFIQKIIRSRHNKGYRQRWRERFGQVGFRLKESILIHSVSMGESIAIAPLVKKLSAQYPTIDIVVTTMTPTGSTHVRKLYHNYANIYHTYLPYDIPIFLNKFFKSINPQVCVIMETELWPNLLAICHKKSIPVILTNARLSEKSADVYAKIRFIMRNMLAHISHISAQNPADRERLIALGMESKNITVTGNIKYDFSVEPNTIKQGDILKAQFGERPVWIAASTHRTEEEIILQAHQKIQGKHPEAILILVPRHPERFNEVYQIIQKHHFTVTRRSLNNGQFNTINVYLADTMGEMMVFYAACDIAFVGGSFSGTGGHNMIEPAALGKPIFSGPSTFNFAQVTQLLLKNKALIIAKNTQELADNIITLFQEKQQQKIMGERALACYNQNKGALAIQLKFIRQFIDASSMATN